MRILVLGALSAIKGADLFEACAGDAARRGLPLEFHLLGYAYRNLSHSGDRLVVHGKYQDHKVPDLLQSLSPHIAWFPARFPETYSYTLSAAMRAELPVATTNLGAIHDRLAGRSLSWALPWESNAQQWNDFFLKLSSDPGSCKSLLIPVASGPTTQFSYLKDYLLPQTTSSKTGDADTDFDAYRGPLRASPKVLMQYFKGYARLCLSAAYRLPGIRRLAVTFFPEHRLQRLRRWLDRF